MTYRIRPNCYCTEPRKLMQWEIWKDNKFTGLAFENLEDTKALCDVLGLSWVVEIHADDVWGNE